MIYKPKDLDSDSLVPRRVREMQERFLARRESSLLDAVSAATALNTVQTADAVDPQMMEAFHLAVPDRDLSEYLDGIDFDNARSVAGAMSNWRGKYFEVIVRDQLNSGEQVGELALDEGQKAVLAERLNEPGWDLQVLDEAGSAVTEYQLKAVQDISGITKALERYPDFEVISTAEAAQEITDPMVASSDISNEEMKSEMTDAVDAVVDTPLVDALELFAQGLPVILIVGSEGMMWLMGRRTFATAFSNSASRAAKTGVAMGAGLIVAAAGASVLSIPTVIATRLAFARHSSFNQLDEEIDKDIDRLRAMNTVAASARE